MTRSAPTAAAADRLLMVCLATGAREVECRTRLEGKDEDGGCCFIQLDRLESYTVYLRRPGYVAPLELRELKQREREHGTILGAQQRSAVTRRDETKRPIHSRQYWKLVSGS
jgi:hypothetical protein